MAEVSGLVLTVLSLPFNLASTLYSYARDFKGVRGYIQQLTIEFLLRKYPIWSFLLSKAAKKGEGKTLVRSASSNMHSLILSQIVPPLFALEIPSLFGGLCMFAVVLANR